jgi:Heterokaryon incompatibility protein (HET)
MSAYIGTRLTSTFTISKLKICYIDDMLYFVNRLQQCFVLLRRKLFNINYSTSSISFFSVSPINSKSAPRSRYQYTNLQNERNIRLLAVYQDEDGNLIGELISKPLDTAKGFTAISYTWGEEKETHELSINGHKHLISRNAHEILHYFATSVDNSLLWIDTICVDQNDDKDKSQQVRLMREIYNKAARVVIWLGSPPKTSLAQDMVTELCSQTSRNETITDKTLELSKETTRQLLSHPYWTRIWVVQEIVVACVAEIFYQGNFYEWEQFVSSAHSLYNDDERTFHRKLIQLEGLNIPHLVGLEKACLINTMRCYYHGKRQQEKETFLPVILMKFFSSQAKFRVDRVFAFRGISSAADDIALEPNYSKLDTKIFKDVARHSLRTNVPGLRFLYFSAAGLANSTKEDWPSWVPDLRGPDIKLAFPLWEFGQYKAGGETYSKIEFLELDRLSVEGVIIDRICAVSNEESKLHGDVYEQLRQNKSIATDSTIITFWESEQPRYKKEWKMVIESKENTDKGNKTVYTLTGETLEEAFLKTLLCDMSSNPFGSEICTSEYSKQWVKFINDDGGFEISNGKLIRIANNVKYDDNGDQIGIDYLPQNLGDLAKFPLRITLSSFKRVFALTDKGYMALVVPGVQAGDYICVFSGSETPHVLRRDEGTGEIYRLVGDAYIHGFMDGKLFDKQTKQHFTIR